jgi:hypothetical protein
MPSAETEALALATREDGSVDIEKYNAEYQRALTERQQRLIREAQPVLRAMEGWRGIEGAADWERAVCKADEAIVSGSFLIERLGGARFLDPELMAVLLVLRGHLIDESGASTAAELMMVDTALLSYAHLLRINSWVGNIAAAAETEFFGHSSFAAKLDRQHGKDATSRGLRAEELVQRMAEQLMPLLDRSNKMMLRNLKALREHRRPPSANLNIGQAGQVNVGAQQVNVAVDEGTGR